MLFFNAVRASKRWRDSHSMASARSCHSTTLPHPNMKSKKLIRGRTHAAIYSKALLSDWVSSMKISNVDDAIVAESDDTLLVFIDEIGDAGLPKGQPFYGLAGCSVFKSDYQRLRESWEGIVVNQMSMERRVQAISASELFTGNRNRKLNGAFIRVMEQAQIWRFGYWIEDLLQFGIRDQAGPAVAAGLGLHMHSFFQAREAPVRIDKCHIFIEESRAWSAALVPELGTLSRGFVSRADGSKKISFHDKTLAAGARIADFISFVVSDRLVTRGAPWKTIGAFRATFHPQTRGQATFAQLRGRVASGHSVSAHLDWRDDGVGGEHF